jgi:hypothetical protein
MIASERSRDPFQCTPIRSTVFWRGCGVEREVRASRSQHTPPRFLGWSRLGWLCARVCAAAGIIVFSSACDLIGSSSKDRGSAVAISKVALQGRAALATDAWSEMPDSYDAAYVNPETWPLRLAGCDSKIEGVPVPQSALPGPSWLLEPLDGQHGAPIRVRAKVGRCATTVALPALGRWRVTLTVRDAQDVPVSAAREMTFRDVLVAAVGDSYASGEGNPDFPTGPGERLWSDAQCHRSRFGWPARVAESLENDSTAVTFLSFACSGAAIGNVSLDSYKGIEKSRAVPPQVVALRRALGDPIVADTRTVDVLLGAVGANDGHFEPILRRCATNPDCQRPNDMSRIGPSYQVLDAAISANLKLGRAYFAAYPERLFTDQFDDYATCSAFELMNASDAAWVTSQGRQLNGLLSANGADNGWSVVPTRDLFRSHGLCATPRDPDGPGRGRDPPSPLPKDWGRGYFHRFLKSYFKQDDIDGTAHPNHRGHNLTADAVRAAVRTDVPPPSKQRLTLHFLRVRVTDLGRDPNYHGSEARPWNGRVTLGMQWYRNGCGSYNRTLRGLSALSSFPESANTGWTDVSDRHCLSYPITTVGRSFLVQGSMRLEKISYADAQIPPRGHPPSGQNRGYEVVRVERRPWVQTGPAGSGHSVYRQRTTHDWGALDIEYEVTSQPVGARP